MSAAIQPADLGFFSVLASAGSLSAAARELGITTPAVSKHLALMESRVGVALVNRTTRRMGLTPDALCYGAAIHACGVCGKADEALRLLREMQDKRLEVNVVVSRRHTGLTCVFVEG